jgi:hypothetical protein
MSDILETPEDRAKFDPSAFAPDTFFHERRTGRDRRDGQAPPPEILERRKKKERRRRVDPTTFEKQYTEDEMEFMTAMQEFKVRTAKAFPTYSEVLAVAKTLGYYRPDLEDDDASSPIPFPSPIPCNGASH